MSRHISTKEERELIEKAGWVRDEDDWWFPRGASSGYGRTCKEALRIVKNSRRRDDE